MMEVGELISFYRRQCGMTIDELAEKSGVAKGTLNKIMGGITKAPTLDNMKAIAKALGKRLSDFDDEPELADMFSPSEQTHVQKYRALDEHGKDAVDTILDCEYKRCQEQNKVQSTPKPTMHLMRMAGRDGTYKEIWMTDEEADEFEKEIAQMEEATGI